MKILHIKIILKTNDDRIGLKNFVQINSVVELRNLNQLFFWFMIMRLP